HVWKRMNIANAAWISDSAQPVCFCMGPTKSVHAYCRLAIMIIAMTDATSWNQRLLMLTMQPLRLSPVRVALDVHRGAWHRRRQRALTASARRAAHPVPPPHP